ncbi:hypothetical protein RchiOBHm_Chr2g0136731 [Rosa chinensis]|uniref:Uncharacterized protein n=1 Tax=Rosa chinensis TaxID=74649 RepID=A0A2P6RWE8_ROSCH|nr:hypothetical protein RchiOBHm_Chr2g0136731 [Rosa chinensis]
MVIGEISINQNRGFLQFFVGFALSLEKRSGIESLASLQSLPSDNDKDMKA